MRSFVEYIESRNAQEFESGVLEILSPVLEGKISFDDLVEQVIIPVFAENPYAESEMDVLNLLREGWWDKVKGWFSGDQSQPQSQPRQSNPKHAAVADQINSQVQDMITQQLLPVIKSISDNLKQSAFKTGNRQLHRAAELFNQKLKQTAEGLKFKISGSLSDEQKDGFNKERMDSRYTPEQRAQLEKQKQMMNNRQQGLDDDGDYRLQPTPEERAAQNAAMGARNNRPAGANNASPMSMQDMNPKQRARLQRQMAQRNARMSRGANVVGSGVGQAPSVGNASVA